MTVVDLILLIQQIPYAGPVIVWIPIVIGAGAALATVIGAPAMDAPLWRWVLYRALQWCAVNVGKARNASDPVSRAEVLTEQTTGATLSMGGNVAVGAAERAAVVASIVDDKATITSVKVKP